MILLVKLGRIHWVAYGSIIQFHEGTKETLHFSVRTLVCTCSVIAVSVSTSCHFYLSPKAPQRLKRLPAMRETWVRSLGQEEPLEKEMATRSSVLAWRTPWTEEPGGLPSTGSQSRTRLSDFTKLQKKCSHFAFPVVKTGL